MSVTQESKVEKVSVFGMGYVGCVTAACLARAGHLVVGVDRDAARAAAVDQGQAPFWEPGLQELLVAARDRQLLSATTDGELAVEASDVAILCVGTPTGPDEAPDLRALVEACSLIGKCLARSPRPFTVIVRSTVPPGTAEEVVTQTLSSASRQRVGTSDSEIVVLTVPEFLREATAIADYDDPPFFVVGAQQPPPARAQELVKRLFGEFEDRSEWVSFRTAELLKNVCNAYHAVKVVFANEVGALCEAVGIDGIEMMRVFCRDTKLNISSAYLRPGLPFGGSCLPKDLRALLHMSRQLRVAVPQLGATLRSNELSIDRAIESIRRLGKRRIGLEGLAFKPGTDDIRESPMVTIAERLIGYGYDLRIYDPVVYRSPVKHREDLAHLMRRLMARPQSFLRHSDVLVRSRSSLDLLETAGRLGLQPQVVDLGRPPYRVVVQPPAAALHGSPSAAAPGQPSAPAPAAAAAPTSPVAAAASSPLAH